MGLSTTVNPYATGSKKPATQTMSVPNVAAAVPRRIESNPSSHELKLAPRPLPLPTHTTASSLPASAPLPAASLPRPVDKKAKLKRDIENLKRMNETKKKLLELEKQRKKEEKRLRKLEASRKEQCAKEGIDYVPPPATVENAQPNGATTYSMSTGEARAAPFRKISVSPITSSLQSAHHQLMTSVIESPLMTEKHSNGSTPQSAGASITSTTAGFTPLAYQPSPTANVTSAPMMQQQLPYNNPMYSMQPGMIPFQQQPWMPPGAWMQPPYFPQHVAPGPYMHAPFPAMVPQQATNDLVPPHLAMNTWRYHVPPQNPTNTFASGLPASQPSLGASTLPAHRPSMPPVPPPVVAPRPAAVPSVPAATAPIAPPDCFSKNILQAPSPFAATHYLLPTPITVLKRPSDTSFGMTLRKRIQSAWIAVDAAADKKAGEDAKDAKPTTVSAPAPPMKVETRLFVLSAERFDEQNSRHDPTTPPDQLLQTDDLVIAINGCSIEGLTFEAAISKIKEASATDAQGNTICQFTIARRKVSTPLTAVEMGAFASCMLKAMLGPKRVLGSSDIPDEHLELDAMLCARNLDQMRFEWERMRSHMQIVMNQKAMEHWKAAWAKETTEIRLLAEFMTDSQRAILRSNAKPAKGCRCGSLDHEYVFDIKCPLYSNLRHLSKRQAEEPVLSMEEEIKRMKTVLPSSRDLNTVEKGFKDRFVREQVEKKLNQRESDFIAEMEELHLRVLKLAVRAPILSAMVLSAVIEVCPEFLQNPSTGAMFVESAVPETSTIEEKKVPDEDDEDDDDVPLVQLAKRPRTDESKAAHADSAQYIRPKFVARLLHAVVNKWGHLYAEPSHADHIWRWEVFHGENAGEKALDKSAASDSWKSYAVNPRQPGALSMEKLRFIVDEALIASLESDQLEEQSRALNLLSMTSFPGACGVLDELLSLCKAGVLRLDENGIPVPPSDWWAKVDLMMLEDMHHNWGNRTDPRGLYGISNKMKKLLGRKWQRTSLGWAMADNAKRIVYDFEDYDEWRRALEEKQQSQTNRLEGVGRFGI